MTLRPIFRVFQRGSFDLVVLRADTESQIRKHVIEAKTDLGDKRLANSGIQIAKSPAEAAEWQSHLDQAKALLAAHLQDALSVASDPTVKERIGTHRHRCGMKLLIARSL